MDASTRRRSVDACAAWMRSEHAAGAFVAKDVEALRARGTTMATLEGMECEDYARAGCGETLGARVRMRRAVRAYGRMVRGEEEGGGRDARRTDGGARFGGRVTIEEDLAPVFDRDRADWGGDGNSMKRTRREGKENARPAPEVKMKKRRLPPPWIRPPGTRFLVDGFAHDLDGCEHWFLTHFHADHYQGLTKKFDRGVVYGTPTTIRLVKERLGVDPRRLRAVRIGERVDVDGVDVTFIDANHCPGAAMILFEFPNNPKAAPVLHTGDFRFHEGMRDDPHLRKAAERAPVLLLDTTYCSLDQDDFPTQKHVLRAMTDALRSEAMFGHRRLFLFGTYTIGKEKVFFEAAKALGQKVYVGKAKLAVLNAIELTKEEKSLITTNDAKTNLHVVPMGSTSFKKMASIMKYYKTRFDSVIAFKPTGWTFSAQSKTSRSTKRRQRGKLVQYGLPYSEHSSLNELRSFVRFINPRKIFPHVNNDCGPRSARMLELLRASDDEYADMLAGHRTTTT